MISSKNKIRIASERDYIKVRDLWDETFTEDSDNWRDWYFDNIYKPQNAILMLDSNGIVSMSHNNPYSMVLNSKILKVSALAGVATRKDSRKRGYAHELIKMCLKDAKSKGDALSFLYPFNYDFYRKYGYEQCYENMIYTVESRDSESLEIKEIDGARDTHMLYSQYAQSLNGYIARGRKYQQIKFSEHFADGNKAYIVLEGNEAVGYAMPEVKAGKVFMNELIAKDIKKAACALSAMFKMPVEYISPIKEDRLYSRTEPHCMVRILDVEKVFSGITAKNCKIAVKINDSILENNNGTFVFEAKDGILTVKKTECVSDMELDILQIATVALGYRNTMVTEASMLFDTFFEKKMPWIVEVC